MADDNDDQTTKLPPLENWAAQTFAYGWLLDRSAAVDYTNNAQPNQHNKGGFNNPAPDDIHLLNLNPQSISVDEPIATAVDSSQGGGKVIESKGGVIKHVSIRGQTGLLPPVAPHATHMTQRVSAFDITNPSFAPVDIVASSKATGYYEFYRLRRLFRQFMKERREGKVVQMHYLDFKADEFWMIEPKRFHMERGRFTYTYDIQFDLIETSQVALDSIQAMDVAFARRGRDKGAEILKLLRNPLHTTFDRPTRQALTRVYQLATNASTFVKNFTTGVLTLKVQSVLSKITAIQEFFGDIASVRRAALDVPLTLYKQLYSALIGLQDSFEDITADAFKADWNEWMIEMEFVTEGLIAHHLDVFGSRPGQAMAEHNSKYTSQLARQGTSNQFMTEQSEDSGSPRVNPFIGQSGLGLIGNTDEMEATTALRPEDVLTGENIFDVAQRLLGDADRFIDLVIINKLNAPYIVSDPKNKLPGTIAWGEKIMVPVPGDISSVTTAAPVTPPVIALSTTCSFLNVATDVIKADTTQAPWRDNMWAGFTVLITSGAQQGQKRVIVSNTADTLTVNRGFAAAIQVGVTFEVKLELFTPRKAVPPETMAYGRGIMAVFTKVNGLITDGTIDVMLSPRKDLATVEGLDNLEQFIAIAMQTPRGSDKAHPLFGTASVIGRRFEPNTAALHVFYIRQSLTQDPRIAAVEQPKVVYDGGAMFFTCYVRPVRAQRTLFFRIPI